MDAYILQTQQCAKWTILTNDIDGMRNVYFVLRQDFVPVLDNIAWSERYGKNMGDTGRGLLLLQKMQVV